MLTFGYTYNTYDTNGKEYIIRYPAPYPELKTTIPQKEKRSNKIITDNKYAYPNN